MLGMTSKVLCNSSSFSWESSVPEAYRHHSSGSPGLPEALKRKLVFLQELQLILGKLQVTANELVKFISEELVDARESLRDLQLRQHSINPSKWCRLQKRETNCQWKSKAKRNTRIYYNSTRKNFRGCNWCGRMGHLEEDCWKKKGLCCLCGSNIHSETACLRYRPRIATEWAVCRGEDSDGGQSNSPISGLDKSDGSLPVGKCDPHLAKGKSYNQKTMKAICILSQEGQLSRDTASSSDDGDSVLTRRQEVVDDSVCFAVQDRVTNGVQDSFVFQPPSATCKDYYKFHWTDEYDKEPVADELTSVDGNQNASRGCKGLENCGVVLTAADETWDLSSIEEPDALAPVSIYSSHSCNRGQSDDAEGLLDRLGGYVEDAVSSVLRQPTGAMVGKFSRSKSSHSCGGHGKGMAMEEYSSHVPTKKSEVREDKRQTSRRMVHQV